MTNHGEAPAKTPLPESLRLRDDLVLHPRSDDAGGCVLEDPHNHRFYRLGPDEQAFLAALTGGATPEAAWNARKHDTADRPASDWSRESAAAFCQWLIKNELTGLAAATGGAAAVPTPLPGRCLALLGRCYFWKASLLDPDRILTAWVPRCRWLFSWQTQLCGLAVLVFGLLLMTGQWSDFFASYENLLTPWRGLWLAVAWVGLKIVHESAHAGTCKSYGGTVRDAGLAIILLMPIAYVDVSSAWRFRSRWQRLHVTLAGVAVELAVAGLALLAWNLADSLPLQQAAADLFLLASISSILFNLNPLLKFDGYFALADITGIDNLYGYGQSYARFWGSRYVLGLDPRQPAMPAGDPAWVKVYGLAAAVYRVFTVSGMTLAAAAIFHGAGILIAAAGAISFALLPLWRLSQHLRQLHSEGKLFAARLAIRLGGLVSIALLLLFVVPADLRQTTPAVVQYDPPAIVRAPLDAFVDSVHVRDGDRVVAGQPIATLRNDELQQRLGMLNKELLQLEQELRGARWNGDLSQSADAQSRLIGLRQQRQQKQTEVDSLIVRAPSDGRIVARQLELLQGCYVRQGDELGAVGFEQRKRLKVSLSQREANFSDDGSQMPVTVIVHRQPAWQAHLAHAESRASQVVPDDALIAPYGGSLAVIKSEEDRFELCEPRINAYVSLTETQSLRLRCGQRAFVRLQCQRRSLGRWIWESLTQGHWTPATASRN
ncbi:biotin/lipoyl-binding protein [Rosistilla oblonga]|uniref:biotin/lipoyl-binding protein n=1 Tax=Rosistilla oblonga TaxID=2527990 RepID=UPI003A97D115